MSSGLATRYANSLMRYSRPVLLLLLVATLVVGSGAANVDGGLTIASFGGDSTEAQKLDYIGSNFSTGQENTTAMQVVVRGDDVLSKQSYLDSLRFQRELTENETVNETLVGGQSTAGLANQVAIAAIQQEQAANRSSGSGNESGGAPGSAGPPDSLPTLDEQIAQLESMSPAAVESVTAAVLDPDRAQAGPVDPYTLLPTDYEAGSTDASARIMFVFQQAPDDADSLPSAVVDAQLATRDIAKQELSDESFVFGAGIVDAESGQATGESFAIISPIAFALVLLVLVVAYRDLLDIALALLGVLLVLVWMGGFMGWAGIGVTQIIIAVPFLLIGLSIDYALHVVMRYREARTEDESRSPREGMRVGLTGVTIALAATTFTTAVGFLSNTVSPIDSIAEFGLVSAFGIVSTFVVFAGVLPTLKVELEQLLERFGFDRRKRAFGTDGLSNRLLGAGTVAARKAPVAVVLVALLLSGGGGYAATDIDTSLNQVDFLPRDSPDWMDSLPGPFQPSDYTLRANAIYLNENFGQSRQGSTAELLVEGSVTDPDTLDRLAVGRDRLDETETAVQLATGEPSVEGPLSLIRQTAATNETVASVVERTDTDGDGIPDSDLAAVYDAVYAAAPDRAEAVIYREGGEYRALRMSVAVEGGADTGVVTEEMRAVAERIERDSALTVTATGQPIVTELVQQGLLRTLVETFLITLGVILAFLTVIFYRRYGTLTLGAVTMVPVVFALSWIFGVMYLVGINFNTETAIIASIAIGIGVDYAIHISERFVEERDRVGDPVAALDATVAGTGGALLASALTTAGGFGVLMFALVPSLQRFGLVTSTAIIFAFLASVVVLPSLLVLWTRLVSSDADPVRADTTGQTTD